MFSRLLCLPLAVGLASFSLRGQPTPAPAPPTTSGDMVSSLTFPNNPVGDLLLTYEALTGKRLIRDSNLSGPTIPLTVAGPLPKDEAVELIRTALIMNGYTFVSVDERTEKVLGPAKIPRSEGVPLYTNVNQLPPGDDIVSYFMPLRYMKVEEAINAFTQYAPPRPFGSYVAVPSVNALVITETAGLVRRLVQLQQVVDVEGARTATTFFDLQHADAEKVAEILQKLFEREDQPRGAANNVTPPPPANPEEGKPAQPAQPGAPTVTGPAPKVQVVADTRTNRVMVLAPVGQLDYIRMLVQNLDTPVAFSEVLERPLRFVRAGDVLKAMAEILKEGTDKEGQEVKIDEGNQAGGEDGGGLGSTGDGSGSASGGSVSTQSQTTFRDEDTRPLFASVGRNTRIIADRSLNKIVVFGPPEARVKAARVLDVLDQRAKQVYLACVIGQLALTNDREFGVDYLIRAGNWRILGQGDANNIGRLLGGNTNTGTDAVPGTSDAVNAAAGLAGTAVPILSGLGGLTVFGTIGDSVDVLVRALATTGRFRVISRPFVYTANGQGALINSGERVPVATGTQSVVTDVNSVNNAGGTFNTSIDYQDVVLELDVRPLINSDREVTLEIKQRNDNVSREVNVGSARVPVIAVQKLNTTVTVPNRHTIVLGGLITEQEDRTQTGVPFLKDIPGLGYFFGTTTKRKNRRELIIMIQPFIINNEESLAEVQRIERANTNFREGMFDTPMPIRAATLPETSVTTTTTKTIIAPVPQEVDFRAR